MRLPFLQIHQDDLARARILARILHVPEAHATGIVVLLDAWALGETEGGVILDPEPAGAVALAVGWEGDAGALLAGLVRVRLIDEHDGNFRVVGTARYDAALSGPSRRSEAARVAAIERWHGKQDADRIASASRRNATSMRIDAKTQTQTQTQTQKETTDLPPSAGASAVHVQGSLLPDVPPTPPTKPAKKAKEAKKPDPPPDPKPYTAACDMLTRVYSEVRNADYGFGLNATRNGKAVRELLWGNGAKGRERGEPLVPLDELERRWRIGLAWNGFPTCSAIWDLREHWAAYAQPQDTSKPRDLSRGMVHAETQHHGEAGEDLSI